MKALKIMTLSTVLLLFGINNIFAQSPGVNLTGSQKEALAKNLEEFHQALNLSEEQKTEFETITKKYAQQMVAVRDGSGGKYKKYKKFKSIQKSKNAEMKKLLSENQYEVFLEKQKEMQKKMKAKRG